MSRTTSSAVDALAPTASIDVRRAGWGAILAATALILTPLIVFVGPLLGVHFRDGAAAYDPVTNASWTGGLFGLLELSQAIGIAFLVVGVRRALPSGWARDVGALAGTLWVAGLTLQASAFMVQFTQAQAENWRSISDEVSIRATIGAAVTVIEWAFFGVAVFAALAWTIAFFVAGRPAGIIGRGAGIPAIVIASIASALAAVGIIPPAATLLQIPLWLILGIVLVRRSAALRY
jgi:hypothetical protein